MLDAELRRRLGDTAQENVRRFDRSRIMNRWDQLVDDLVVRPKPSKSAQATAH